MPGLPGIIRGGDPVRRSFFFTDYEEREDFLRYVADLLLFTPFGIGYAFSWSDVMELDTDVADLLREKKVEALTAFSKTPQTRG